MMGRRWDLRPPVSGRLGIVGTIFGIAWPSVKHYRTKPSSPLAAVIKRQGAYPKKDE